MITHLKADIKKERPVQHASGDGASGGELPKLVMAFSDETNWLKDRVVLALLRKKIVSKDLVQQTQARAQHDGKSEALWRLLADHPGVNREQIYAEAARTYAFKEANLSPGHPNPDLVRGVLDTFSEQQRQQLLNLRILPYDYVLEPQYNGLKRIFITHDPASPAAHRLMRGLGVELFELQYAPEQAVSGLIEELFPRKNEFLERISEDPMAFDLGTTFDERASRLFDEEALEAEISRSSLINLVEAALVEAVRMGASDIHIFPNARRQTEFHFRIDGRLQLWHREDKVHPESILAVVKDNAINIDRFERDAAQDGFIQRLIDDVMIRFRVSVLPIATAAAEIRGESIVVRVLDDRKVISDLGKLGLNANALNRFNKAIRLPHGMVILTGPTGSGKSTTLVATLSQVVTPEVNVLTVEDPVEYIIPGVRQIKLNHKLDLEGALRSILRHDPDVVMVGEMRDKATADLAIKLANTGHLTFSTLHTNDAPSAISRLYKMGIEPFLLAYAINLVVAQRLVRTVCQSCRKIEIEPDALLLAELGFSDEEVRTTTFYAPGADKHCRSCRGKGYKGRRAITEALYFSRAIRHLIVKSGGEIDEAAIRDTAVSEGMCTLRASARELVLTGETTVDELIRVTASE